MAASTCVPSAAAAPGRAPGAPRLRRVGQFTAPGTFFWGVDVDPKAQTLYATARDRLYVLLPTGAARS